MEASFNLNLLYTPFFLTSIAILVLIPVAHFVGLTDKPSSRKKHDGEIPLIGGIAIYFGLLISVYMVGLNESGSREFYILSTALTLIVVLGLIDDKYHLGIRIRFIGQSIAVLIMIFGLKAEIVQLGNILGFGVLKLGLTSVFFTVFAFVGGINAFNMLDGLDGLAGSLSIMYLVILAALFGYFNNTNMFDTCVLLSMSLLAFLVFNSRFFGRKKALIFLGDTGSMLLGFVLVWMLIYLSQIAKVIYPVTVLWILAIPLFDTVGIMLRRIRKGQSPFHADRGHFHHILLHAGYSVNQTVFFIISISAVFSLFGIMCQFMRIPEWVMFYSFLTSFALYYWGISHAWHVMKKVRHIRLPEARDRLIIISRRVEIDRRVVAERRVHSSPWYQYERRILIDRRLGVDRRG